MFCSKCGQQNLDSSSFCMKCGHSLRELPTAPQTQVIPASPEIPDSSYSSNSSGTSNAEGSKGAKAVRAVGHTIGFTGRLLWTLVNWALGLLVIVLAFKGLFPQWWAYILEPAFAIFCIVNGFRCITGRSYWIFF